MLKVGIGRSVLTNAREAVQEAMSQATGAGAIDTIFLFCGPGHDPTLIYKEIREAAGGDVNIFGGSTVGIITNDHLSYSGDELGLAVIPKGSFRSDLLRASDIVSNELAAGRSIATQRNERVINTDSEHSNLLFIYDSLARTAKLGPPSLNLASPMIQGLMEGIGQPHPKRTAGMGLLQDPALLSACHSWGISGAESQSLTALTIDGNIRMDSLILHGCLPMGGYLKITKATDNIIYEIDGIRATDRILQLLGTGSQFSVKDFPLFITLGVNKGDPYGPYRAEHYANRLCFAVLEEEGALVMFEPDLKTGDKVQLMRRSIDHAYIRGEIDSYFSNLKEASNPCFAFYIDCMGRAAKFCGAETEEAAEVQRAMNDRGIPLLGVYSGVEVAPVGDHLQALDWTGVLCLFHETP